MRIHHVLTASAMLWASFALGAHGAANAQENAVVASPLGEPASRLVFVSAPVQDTPSEVRVAPVGPQPVTRVFEIRHLRAEGFVRTLALFPAEIHGNNEFRTLTVRANPDIMSAIEDVIESMDVPAVEPPVRAVEVTAYILSPDSDGSGNTVPTHLETVAEQLRNTFGYGGMRLIDTVFIRGFNNSQVTVHGMTTLPSVANDSNSSASYQLAGSFRVLEQDDSSLTLRIDRLSADFNVRDGGRLLGVIGGVTIRTSVDIPAGTQVVVGKTSTGDGALFLVMTAAFPE